MAATGLNIPGKHTIGWMWSRRSSGSHDNPPKPSESDEDASQAALRQVREITESELVNGEDLLESEDLRRK